MMKSTPEMVVRGLEMMELTLEAVNRTPQLPVTEAKTSAGLDLRPFCVHSLHSARRKDFFIR